VAPLGSRPSDRSGGDEHRAIEQVANGTERRLENYIISINAEPETEKAPKE